MQTLSFGTVIDVLHQCKKAKVKKADLTMAVINIAIPQNTYENFKDSYFDRKLNFIYTCETYLETRFNNGNPLSPLKPDNTIIKQFDETVVPLIDNDRRRLAILALCDMIEKDCSLGSRNVGKNISIFEAYIEDPIQKILNDKEYIFSEFLAKICLYVIFEVDNRVCQNWIKRLSKKYNAYDKAFKSYVDGFKNSKREIKVFGTSSEKEQSQNTTFQTIGNRTVLTPSKEDTLGDETYKIYRRLTNTYAVRDIGSKNEMCLCCENWTGDMENAFKAPHGSLGMCTLKNEEMLSTNPMCKWAIPSLQRANKRWPSMFDSQ